MATPVVGFFDNQPGPPLIVHTTRSFAASTAAKMSHEDWCALDCRHGRALLANRHSSALLVWDIVTGEQSYLPTPPAAPCGGACSECNSRPFLVVYMCSPDNCIALHCLACAYSSEAGFWTEITSIDIPSYSVDFKTAALVGSILYCLLDNSSIIEFDYGRPS
jgi:hypothetical protein